MSREESKQYQRKIDENVTELLEIENAKIHDYNEEGAPSASHLKLAEALQLDIADLTAKLGGRRDFDLSEIAAISKYFNISTDRLLGLDDYSGKYPLSDFLRLLFEADRIFPLNLETGVRHLDINGDIIPNFDPAQDNTNYWRSVNYANIIIDKEELIQYLKAWEYYRKPLLDDADSKELLCNEVIMKKVIREFETEALLKAREQSAKNVDKK